MINSRSVTELHPKVATMAMAMVQACDEAGIDLLITSTYRDHESQNALYAQGRTKPGDIVTNAKGGQSYHQFRVAFDVVPLRNGKCVWDAKDPAWLKVGEIGESVGLEWGGRWTGRLRDRPHFQYTGGLTLADLQNGTMIA
jgi:peptidoglycan L-alanyl-D-glutamate endopeptidase CwlK